MKLSQLKRTSKTLKLTSNTNGTQSKTPMDSGLCLKQLLIIHTPTTKTNMLTIVAYFKSILSQIQSAPQPVALNSNTQS